MLDDKEIGNIIIIMPSFPIVGEVSYRTTVLTMFIMRKAIVVV